MNTKDFVQVLRKIIKEEVKSAVQEAIRDISTDSLVEQIVTKPQYDYKPKKSTNKQFTKDPLLNSLLNETAATSPGIPAEHNDYSEWPTMQIGRAHV